MRTIDLNSDLGEGFGVYRIGSDKDVLRYVSSANVACGFHAGDPNTIAETVATALSSGVSIGAHPGFPDLQGFGRRTMGVTPQEAYNLTLYQIGALKVFVEAGGGRLAHVKAHGALFNQAARDLRLAQALAAAVHAVDPNLLFYGLSGSVLISAAKDLGLTAVEETYADRTYEDDGTLTPRADNCSLITDINASIRQVMEMMEHGFVRSRSGAKVRVRPDTLCIHGDQPRAAEFAQRIRTSLEAVGYVVAAPCTKVQPRMEFGSA